MKRPSLLCAALAALALRCAADTVVLKSLDSTADGATSHEGRDCIIFDDFTLADAAQINRVDWYGQFSSGTETAHVDTGAFNVYVLADDPNAPIGYPPVPMTGRDSRPPPPRQTTDGPGAILFAFQMTAFGSGTGLNDNLPGGEILAWTLSLPAFSLEAGRYWLAISAASEDPGWFLWNRAEGADGVDRFGQIFNGAPVFNTTEDDLTMAFGLGYDADGAARATFTANPVTEPVPDNAPSIGLLALSLTILGGRSIRLLTRRCQAAIVLVHEALAHLGHLRVPPAQSRAR